MKVKNANLEWYVLKHDFSTGEIRPYNVLGQGFVEKLHKKIRAKKVTNYEELKDYIDWELKYYYWCRAEHEIAVGSIFSKSEADLFKIDAYTQLNMNLDRIVEYVNRELRINF